MRGVCCYSSALCANKELFIEHRLFDWQDDSVLRVCFSKKISFVESEGHKVNRLPSYPRQPLREWYLGVTVVTKLPSN
jgi:hypothetical protein